MSCDQFVTERRAGLLCEIGGAGDDLRRRIGLSMRADWHRTRLQQALVETFRAVCAERSNDADNAWPFRYPRR
ncbi:hypothetical protein [Stenotrophomonas sp. JAI102]|uniref:hypothetical protein n=1 Tax=Stenotrophomonas sp. JAI102 TaxID=2723077 RepID=UPI0015CDCD74|nr:hypothetical protein [Stenotrophomonas sp. JAI102]NYF35242.1 hypothetical protein [Stenotrophomonas sp. JAI102]